jgi:hypothetical protein
VELAKDRNSGPISGRILGDDVAVRIGSQLLDAPPSVEAKIKLKRGTLVLVFETKTASNEEGTWFPIAPPSGDVRYISADAIQSTPVVQRVQSSPAVGAPPSAAAPGSDDDLVQQAEKAEKEGRAADACDLYHKLALQTTDHQLKTKCYNRMHFLREGNRGSVPPGYQQGHPSEAQYPVQNNRLTPTPGYPTWQAGQPAPGQVTSQYTQPETHTTVYQPMPPGGATQPGAPANTLQRSGPGRLWRAAFPIDGRVAYMLEGSDGRPRMYVTSPNFNLESFVGKNVELFGNISMRADVKWCITVNYLQLLQ